MDFIKSERHVSLLYWFKAITEHRMNMPASSAADGVCGVAGLVSSAIQGLRHDRDPPRKEPSAMQ